MEDKVIEKEYTPAEYFALVKGKKQSITDEDLDSIYANCLELLNKYNITQQYQAMKKLMFHLENIERERQIIKLGINQFVYKSDIQDFVKNVEDRVVKVIELSRYEREVPDDITEVVRQTRDLFTEFYVVYTDYTGETERQVEQYRRATDPILFGSFLDRESAVIVERFYFLGDWEDEYCDLTLDKMVAEIKNRTGRNVVMSIQTPEDIKDLKGQLNNLKHTRNGFVQIENKPMKSNVFSRVYKAIKG